MSEQEQPRELGLIIGTAGHVDHGKSKLIEALTGTDPDRLDEEHRRGISIRLGFAFLQTPEGELGIVDVPGHEGLVREMVAGATGFDAVLFVVAADEGLMPQSREHLEILDLLLERRTRPPGVVALTKVDLIEDPEWLELVAEELREQLTGTVLEGAPVVRTSARTGVGLEELRERLFTVASSCKRLERPGAAFRLAADRAFTVEGFGSVVTGAVRSGSLAVGDEVELLPGGAGGRVRNLQTNRRDRQVVAAGRRVAVNLSGLPKRGVKRGDELIAPGCFAATRRLDVRLRLLNSSKPLADLSELKLLAGTREELCRVVLLEGGKLKPGGDCLAQLELRRPLVFARGDRFILRVPSPPRTVAGGRVIDPLAQRHRRSRSSYRAALGELESADDATAPLLWLKHNPLPDKALTAADIARREGLMPGYVKSLLAESAERDRVVHLGGERWLHPRWRTEVVDKLSRGLARFLQKHLPYQPLDRGQIKALLRDKKVDDGLLSGAVEELLERGSLLRYGSAYAPAPQGAPPNKLLDVVEELRGLLRVSDPALLLPEAAVELNRSPERVIEAAHYLRAVGEAALLAEVYLWPAAIYRKLRRRVLDELEDGGELRVADFKDAVGLSRKFATQFLDHLYEAGMTDRRSGSHRLLDAGRGRFDPLDPGLA